ncbi:MAG: T9SS C-terminal target domain-containing protein, partial [Ignavibacteriales bacterium]
KFDLPVDGLITLEIYDILGRKISTLINEHRQAGSYEQVFDASSLSSGVYVYKLQAIDPSSNSGRSFVQSKKLILLK